MSLIVVGHCWYMTLWILYGPYTVTIKPPATVLLTPHAVTSCRLLYYADTICSDKPPATVLLTPYAVTSHQLQLHYWHHCKLDAPVPVNRHTGSVQLLNYYYYYYYCCYCYYTDVLVMWFVYSAQVWRPVPCCTAWFSVCTTVSTLPTPSTTCVPAVSSPTSGLSHPTSPNSGGWRGGSSLCGCKALLQSTNRDTIITVLDSNNGAKRSFYLVPLLLFGLEQYQWRQRSKTKLHVGPLPFSMIFIFQWLQLLWEDCRRELFRVSIHTQYITSHKWHSCFSIVRVLHLTSQCVHCFQQSSARAQWFTGRHRLCALALGPHPPHSVACHILHHL